MALNMLRLRYLLMLPVVAIGAITGVGALGASATQAVAASSSHGRQGSYTATAARQISVNETSHLHLVSHHGTQVLNEQGSSTGTPGGSLTIHVNIAYTQATITFTAYPNGGVLSGQGEATYYAEGSVAHFTGTVRVTHGSGRYAHASASNLRIQGKIERNHNYALYVKVTGQMRY
jgi:hypothetical protein